MPPVRLSVLVVDDDISLRFISKRYLEESGTFSVYTAESATEALTFLESPELRFDAIISDYYMPGYDGMWFLKHVRSRYGSIPFILFTGKEEDQIISAARDAGADHVLIKQRDMKSQWMEIAHIIKEGTLERVIEEMLPEVLVPLSIPGLKKHEPRSGTESSTDPREDLSPVTTVRDATTLGKIEEGLHRAKEKLNNLASVTRHDILNQVQAIEAFCDLLEIRVKQDTIANEYLTYIRQSCEKIDQQIRFSREYQRLGDKEPAWQHIETIVATAVAETLPDTITATITTGGIEIFADPMLSLVFVNLFNTIREHGMSVTLVSVNFFVMDREGVLTITDNGTGVPDDRKEEIFERGGSNSGFSLFFAREILEISGISIVETGTYGKGACFTITIPPGTWRSITG
ncbi:MAG: hybrid sensor histidine kinase/response regulator [Methanospirillum sp.]|uniref:ATP-binding response regulator n=1 Tax=Methanospirillum sp. TaxID=45200 RepID=UPI0023713469|nr:hybrid sensor histidine kinase/response regulator [Methanospirillum sp.]MDD1730251.1 hybrid sensor histidine kinase/response regulator [Methanospirillum sp.]